VSFTTTVTAQDLFNITANTSGTVVTMTSSTGHAQFDSDGNGSFGDNTKVLANGAFTIATIDNSIESVTITATDTNAKTGTSSTITVAIGPFGAPPGFTANATSTSEVSLSWTAVSGATNYEVWRSSLGSAYSLLKTTGLTTTSDSGLTANRTYLYKVRAVNGGGSSGFSTPDAATTVIFTDSALSAGNAIKAVHITELRNAINLVRAAAGLSAATFTDSALTAGNTIKGVHMTELRTALDAARSAAGLAALSYTDPTITTGVTRAKVVHITQLRGGVQ
jgi:hypothetical protein